MKYRRFKIERFEGRFPEWEARYRGKWFQGLSLASLKQQINKYWK